MHPSHDEVVKWRSRIESALQSRTLSSGEASKLAGALQWGAQYIFRRLGRAMLRPIFQCVCTACTLLPACHFMCAMTGKLRGGPVRSHQSWNLHSVGGSKC